MRRIASFVAAWLMATATYADAMEPAGSLITSAGWVKLHIVFGRFQAVASQPRLRQEASNRDQESFTFQSHSVSAQDGVAEIDYLLKSPHDYLSVKWRPDGAFHIRHERVDEQHLTVTYDQPAKGKVVLTVQRCGKRTTVRGADLWSLAISHREICDKYLAPSIAAFYPSLRITEMRDRIVDELFYIATQERPCPVGVEKLVEQLGADRFRMRRKAEEQLKELGPGVLRHLATENPRHLDAEQKRRIRRVRQHYRVASPDCCERVAAWLAPLPRTWLALMDDSQIQRREKAFAALCQSCDDRELVFTPHANDDQRQAEINELESQLVKN